MVEPPTDPAAIPPITYAWVVGLSIWGGIANFCHKMKTGHARPFNIAELIGELLISGFAGVLTFYICKATGIEGVTAAVFVGISGHMGSRAIFAFERWAMKRWGQVEIDRPN